MSKRSKAEPTAADTAATPAPVQVGNDATLPPARRSRRAGRPCRVGRIHRPSHRDRTSLVARRLTTTGSANGAITPDASSDGQAVTLPTAPANDVSATDTTAENDASRHSLTAQFQAWNEKSIESAIEKGRVIKRGQKELKEEWTAWVVDDLRLSAWSAGLYVHISEHPILSDKKYWKHLPVDYRTLYELSQMDAGKLLEYITKGGVHHDLRRAQAVKLKLDGSDEPPKETLPSPNIPDALEVLLNVARYFRQDKDWQAYMRQNPRPSELPSKDDIEAAVQYVETKRRQMRGER